MMPARFQNRLSIKIITKAKFEHSKYEGRSKKKREKKVKMQVGH